MTGMLEVPELGLTQATSCQASGSHTPTPLRYVWHHIQPHEAGGPTTTANLAHLCDSCHYSIHRILYAMRQTALGIALTPGQQAALTKPPRRAQYLIAEQGYEACRAANTIQQIPNEG